MVLSPIDPVAPSTLMLREPLATGLLFFNGTALITSPNHKTASDAIDPAANNTDRGREHDRCDEAVDPVQHAAVTGNDVAGILDAETALHRRLEQVAKLRHDREHRCQHQ